MSQYDNRWNHQKEINRYLMTTENTNLLFSWENVELLPDLQRLKLVLDTLPSEAVIGALKARRGHGRNDFPVAAMFNALIAGIVFQHPSSSSLLRELHRGEKLAQLCGFNCCVKAHRMYSCGAGKTVGCMASGFLSRCVCRCPMNGIGCGFCIG